MLQKYIIYFSLKESCDVYFSPMYSSFNIAREQIDDFLENYAKKRGKKLINVTKEELEKLKLTKKPENCFYVRRKNSETIVYHVNISEGTFYNSYSIEKFGKVNINEFLFQQKEESIPEEKVTELYVTNHERGAHVSFLSELKDVINKRENKKVNFDLTNKNEKQDTPFVLSLKEGKQKLRKITPPLPRKINY